MGALTPQFLTSLESRMQIITENEYGRLLQNLWWREVAAVRRTEAAKDIVAWLLQTAQIRDEGTKGGNIHFEDLVTAQTTIEHRFSGAGLKLLRQQFEDTDGMGLNLAAEWSAQIGAQMAYWPQIQIANFLKNGHLASVTAYDGRPFFATNHLANPFRTDGPTFANVFTGAAAAATSLAPAYPGAIDVSEAVPVDTALANLNKIYSYIASIKMPNGDMPRYLRPRAILAPPALMFRLVQLTNAKVIAQTTSAGGAAAADVETSIRMLGYANPIQVDELAGYENDKTFFIIAEQAATSQLGAVVFVEREPYKINYYGPQTDAELSRKDELEWHAKGRNGVAAGHPYLIFKVRAT